MEEDSHSLIASPTSATTTATTTLTPPPFQIDERVYCRDDSRNSSHYCHYEAVIRKARFVDHKWSFFVHFSGWNNRWDRWIETTGGSSTILKDTEENRALVQQEQENPTPAAAAAAAVEATSQSAGPKRSRNENRGGAKTATSRKRLAVRNGDAAAASSSGSMDLSRLVYADYCELPFTLKTVLVEEYERIAPSTTTSNDSYDCEGTPRRLVHQLPAPVTVRKVLHHFCKKKIKECNQQDTAAAAAVTVEESTPNTNRRLTVELVQSFCQGLTQLFQDALPVCLLYPQERTQYATLDKEKELVDVYGCEYLLRLYVRLPILLQDGNNSSGSGSSSSSKHQEWWSPTVIGPLLTDLLVLMQKNRHALFPMTVAGENCNYRAPLPKEWMDWEIRLYAASKQPPLSPNVGMDTR